MEIYAISKYNLAVDSLAYFAYASSDICFMWRPLLRILVCFYYAIFLFSPDFCFFIKDKIIIFILTFPLLWLIRRKNCLSGKVINRTHRMKVEHKINSHPEKKNSVVWRRWFWKVHQALVGINRTETNLEAKIFSEQEAKLVGRAKQYVLNIYLFSFQGLRTP